VGDPTGATGVGIGTGTPGCGAPAGGCGSEGTGAGAEGSDGLETGGIEGAGTGGSAGAETGGSAGGLTGSCAVTGGTPICARLTGTSTQTPISTTKIAVPHSRGVTGLLLTACVPHLRRWNCLNRQLPRTPGVYSGDSPRIRRRMKALVTGGAGFIGSNLVDALLARGDEVTVVDDLSTGKRENLEGALSGGATLAETDIRDAEAVADVVARTKPDVIFHLAAQIDVRKSVADPANDARINVEGTINVLSAAQAHGVPRVVNTSTGGAIYGEGRQLPAPEDHPSAPEAPYGLSKWCAEQYCEIFTRLHGLSTVSLRYGNVYGPRQDPLGEAGVVAIFCGKLLEGETATIFGDGKQTRDYVYVEDVVEANLRAAEADATGPINIGLGEEKSVLDIVDVLKRHAPDGFDVEHAPERPGEVQHIALDPSRAREELGWQAQVKLDEGLKRTLDSLR
jgi:UDP-glucose 4-epimerase